MIIETVSIIFVTKHNQYSHLSSKLRDQHQCPFRDVTTGGVVRHLVAIKCHSAFLKTKVSNVPINNPQGFNDVGCRPYWSATLTQATFYRTDCLFLLDNRAEPLCLDISDLWALVEWLFMLISSDRAGMVTYQQGAVRTVTWTAGWSLTKGLEEKTHTVKAFYICFTVGPSQEMAMVK